MLDACERLVVALDVRTAVEAQNLVYSLGASVGLFKVGLQLYIAEGPNLVRELVNSGKKVFLDLKLHDIPNTVAAAVRSAAELKVHMLTIHTQGGPKMLAAAVKAARSSLNPPLILGVTVLTSMDEVDLDATGIAANIEAQTLRLARLANQAGMNGIVASPLEAAKLRKELGNDMTLVCPGIRPSGSNPDDQIRTATPAEAIRAGANYLVVGRPITEASDPTHVVRGILREIESTLEK